MAAAATQATHILFPRPRELRDRGQLKTYLVKCFKAFPEVDLIVVQGCHDQRRWRMIMRRSHHT
jgi:hypothetical protein